jgi:hypothetical protein
VTSLTLRVCGTQAECDDLGTRATKIQDENESLRDEVEKLKALCGHLQAEKEHLQAQVRLADNREKRGYPGLPLREGGSAGLAGRGVSTRSAGGATSCREGSTYLLGERGVTEGAPYPEPIHTPAPILPSHRRCSPLDVPIRLPLSGKCSTGPGWWPGTRRVCASFAR